MAAWGWRGAGETATRDRITPRPVLARLEGPPRLVRRHGTEAGLVLTTAREVTGLGDEELLAPVDPSLGITLAELVLGVTHEGARTVEDLLERRTRVALVPADVPLAVPAAERALQYARATIAG